MLNADDLVILAETFEALITKMAVWKNGLESKGEGEYGENQTYDIRYKSSYIANFW